MLERCRNAQERWGGVHELIDRWLRERQDLVTELFGLGKGVEPGAQGAEALRGLCQIMLDYVSAWHFGVYEQLLIEAREFNDQRGLEVASQIQPRIEAITAQVVAFNDRWPAGRCASDPALAGELQQLGRLFCERFELEDCLIEVLHNAHRQKAQAVAGHQ